MNQAPREVPAWAADADRLLRLLSGRVRLISQVTPVNLEEELASLSADWKAGKYRPPLWRWGPSAMLGAEREALRALAARLEREGPLGEAYAARSRELELEAALAEAAGSQALRVLARTRYQVEGALEQKTKELAEAWLAQTPPRDPSAASIVADDENDPKSLVSQMRAACAKARVGYVVTIGSGFALAATGDGVVQISRGRTVTEADVRRTVLHEVEGHVLPRWRAREEPLGLFRIGSEGGSDDQEGRALLLEEEAGMLTALRKQELAVRHLACTDVRGGTEFVESARQLMARGAPLDMVLRACARAARGGGLAREVVYLARYVALGEVKRGDPERWSALGHGSIAWRWWPALEPYRTSRS